MAERCKLCGAPLDNDGRCVSVLCLRAQVARLEGELAVARAETKELAEKGYEASVWGWSKERTRICDALHEAQAAIAAKDAALEPFAEVYGRRSKLVRGTRGMNQVAKSHRVGLISEQSDGHFGYLPISAFRDAALAGASPRG